MRMITRHSSFEQDVNFLREKEHFWKQTAIEIYAQQKIKSKMRILKELAESCDDHIDRFIKKYHIDINHDLLQKTETEDLIAMADPMENKILKKGKKK